MQDGGYSERASAGGNRPDVFSAQQGLGLTRRGCDDRRPTNIDNSPKSWRAIVVLDALRRETEETLSEK